MGADAATMHEMLPVNVRDESESALTPTLGEIASEVVMERADAEDVLDVECELESESSDDEE